MKTLLLHFGDDFFDQITKKRFLWYIFYSYLIQIQYVFFLCTKIIKILLHFGGEFLSWSKFFCTNCKDQYFRALLVGLKFPIICLVELMFNVVQGGRITFSQIWSRDLGQRKKMKKSFCWSINTALENGLLLQNISEVNYAKLITFRLNIIFFKYIL